jgi:RNA polymerase sigma factor (TIGR02999 family)
MEAKQDQITRLLQEWQNGKSDAIEELMPFIYRELRKRAAGFLRNERREHTMQTTDLINEAYINLVGKKIDWESRSHFLAIASKAMRRILVDHSRAKKRGKRGGDHVKVDLDEANTVVFDDARTDLVLIDEALQRLQNFDARMASVVELKFFGGFSNDETAKILSVSNVTVRRDWKMAKAWLYEELGNRK